MLRKGSSIVGILVLSGLAGGCGHGKISVDQEATRGVVEGVFEISAEWVKPKGDKYDIRLKLYNPSENGVIVQLHDLHCFRGTVSGELKHTFFNTGERTIDLKPGETKKMNTVCRFSDQEPTGEFRVVAKRVYEDKDGEGKKLGKVIAKDVTWKMPDQEATK